MPAITADSAAVCPAAVSLSLPKRSISPITIRPATEPKRNVSHSPQNWKVRTIRRTEHSPEPRFTDNGDGTVTDSLTGLIWLQDADCPASFPASLMTWQEALDWVDDLNTTAIACTNYTPMTFTDWRLPNIKELLSLADYGRTPAIPRNKEFTNVRHDYWSSSSFVKSPSDAWMLNIVAGHSDRDFSKTLRTLSVWPVRGGR